MLPSEALLEVYVDDPLSAVAGPTRAARTRSFALILLLWEAMGFRLAWKKGQRGSSVEWTGAEITIGSGAVEVRLTEAKTQTMVQDLRA
eukprot:12284133-Alexandrium_andersonii.AAC.1